MGQSDVFEVQERITRPSSRPSGLPRFTLRRSFVRIVPGGAGRAPGHLYPVLRRWGQMYLVPLGRQSGGRRRLTGDDWMIAVLVWANGVIWSMSRSRSPTERT